MWLMLTFLSISAADGQSESDLHKKHGRDKPHRHGHDEDNTLSDLCSLPYDVA